MLMRKKILIFVVCVGSALLVGTFAIVNFVQISAGFLPKSWASTDGVVVDSSIEHFKSSTTNWLVISYEYTVDGVLYKSNRNSFSMINNFSEVGETYQQLLSSQQNVGLPGQTIKVYYDPKRPSIATLKLGINWPNLFLLFFASALCLYLTVTLTYSIFWLN